MSYALGLDYGTNSCRALLVDLATGAEIATAVFDYPSGERGILTDSADPHLARQHPGDYRLGLERVIRDALAAAKEANPRFDPADVVGIGVDTTGSTVIPVNREGTPLALLPEFKGNLHAETWLWKDHTAHQEAEAITEKARALRPRYLARCGGAYSSEWFWAKIWRCKRVAPDVFAAAWSWVELCDWLPAVLTGNMRPDSMRRGVCAAGHKAMFAEDWGGLPDQEFLGGLDAGLASLRDRLYSEAFPAETPAGGLSREWAEKTGLREGTTVAVGAFDAHMGAVGAGVREGVLVKILGTSTCDVMVRRADRPLGDIPGVCGIVNGSVLGGYFGVEAGQSAVGDIFLWFVDNLVPEAWGRTPEEKFAALGAGAAALFPGRSGLLALDWHNGNRTILVDPRLTGLLVGQTLRTRPDEIYRALMEATAFGALRIIERLEEHGMPVREVVNCGGLADRNGLLLQIYADVTGRPMRVARSAQTCALGAALFGAVAAGRFASVEAAQAVLCGVREAEYRPDPAAAAVYRELYALYRRLHDAFGIAGGSGDLHDIMKRLLDIRERAAARSGSRAA